MTFMIVASPCAVVLATMPPLLSTIANAGRHGVLVKSAVALEKFGKTDLVAFDKTGTLTEGTPRVSEIEPVPGAGLTKERLLALAAAAERPSEHPLARAVVAAAHELDVAVPHSEAFASTPGRGVTALVDGIRVRVGSPALLDDLPGAAPAAVDGGPRPGARAGGGRPHGRRGRRRRRPRRRARAGGPGPAGRPGGRRRTHGR